MFSSSIPPPPPPFLDKEIVQKLQDDTEKLFCLLNALHNLNL